MWPPTSAVAFVSLDPLPPAPTTATLILSLGETFRAVRTALQPGINTAPAVTALYLMKVRRLTVGAIPEGEKDLGNVMGMGQ